MSVMTMLRNRENPATDAHRYTRIGFLIHVDPVVMFGGP